MHLPTSNCAQVSFCSLFLHQSIVLVSNCLIEIMRNYYVFYHCWIVFRFTIASNIIILSHVIYVYYLVTIYTTVEYQTSTNLGIKEREELASAEENWSGLESSSEDGKKQRENVPPRSCSIDVSVSKRYFKKASRKVTSKYSKLQIVTLFA